MDTGVIIAIVVAALIVLALLMLLSRKGRERKHEANRHEAREIRREAEVGRAQADKTKADADVKAAEARRQEAQAREQAAEADERHREVRERHLEAARLDPDVDEKEAAERYDRDGPDGITAHGYGEHDDSGAGAARAPSGDLDNQSVEHHEHTETAGVEHERHYERDDEGNVVRDEEREHPRS